MVNYGLCLISSMQKNSVMLLEQKNSVKSAFMLVILQKLASNLAVDIMWTNLQLLQIYTTVLSKKRGGEQLKKTTTGITS